MTLRKKIFSKFLLCFVFSIVATGNIKAQICSGSWANNSTLNWICIYGDWIGRFNGNPEPLGCPVNPVYTSGQTNTYTFDYTVESFIIDFKAFTSASGCARMEIKINGIFYPLTSANIMDIPSSVGCPGTSSFITVTNDGYITSTSISTTTSNGTARILINGVNASSVTISTNDPAGTIVSDPFNCTIVPLILESFTGKSNNCKTLLNWKTGTEQNVKIIEIQRSDDGSIFNKAGDVSPKGSNSFYSFVHNDYSDVYFRLKIIDLDRSYNYSEVLYIKSSCNKNVYSVTPNPASNEVEIIGLKSNDQVLILDMLGNVVNRFYSSQSNNKFNIQTLPSGMYIFQVINSNRNPSLKVIKY